VQPDEKPFDEEAVPDGVIEAEESLSRADVEKLRADPRLKRAETSKISQAEGKVPKNMEAK
jgi:hypothetical protein